MDDQRKICRTQAGFFHRLADAPKDAFFRRMRGCRNLAGVQLAAVRDGNIGKRTANICGKTGLCHMIQVYPLGPGRL